MKLLRLVSVLEAGQAPLSRETFLWSAELMTTYWAMHGKPSVDMWTWKKPLMGME